MSSSFNNGGAMQYEYGRRASLEGRDWKREKTAKKKEVEAKGNLT